MLMGAGQLTSTVTPSPSWPALLRPHDNTRKICPASLVGMTTDPIRTSSTDSRTSLKDIYQCVGWCWLLLLAGGDVLQENCKCERRVLDQIEIFIFVGINFRLVVGW